MLSAAKPLMLGAMRLLGITGREKPAMNTEGRE